MNRNKTIKRVIKTIIKVKKILKYQNEVKTEPIFFDNLFLNPFL